MGQLVSGRGLNVGENHGAFVENSQQLAGKARIVRDKDTELRLTSFFDAVRGQGFWGFFSILWDNLLAAGAQTWAQITTPSLKTHSNWPARCALSMTELSSWGWLYFLVSFMGRVSLGFS